MKVKVKILVDSFTQEIQTLYDEVIYMSPSKFPIYEEIKGSILSELGKKIKRYEHIDSGAVSNGEKEIEDILDKLWHSGKVLIDDEYDYLNKEGHYNDWIRLGPPSLSQLYNLDGPMKTTRIILLNDQKNKDLINLYKKLKDN
jgi:hypothetical protein